MNVMMKRSDIRLPFRLTALIIGLFLTVGSFAQITVKGHVKDATGEPIIGATIRVAGSNAGTVSDFDGNFSINAANGATLSVSYVGYQPATVTVNGTTVSVTLQDDAKLLDNVVVIGYGRAKKSDLTGSVTAIKPDEENKGMIVNAQDMIQGKIAGVNVVSSGGQPGGGATIRIRGGASLNASNNPLYVIDGLAMDNNGVQGLSNPLSMINPNDIESFTVLKDASATAIYGSRGSNGVIIITTKKGRSGMAPKVSYNGYVSMSMKRKTIDVLDGNQMREFIKNYYGENSDAYNKLGDANTDWQDEIYHTAISHDHNVTVQGGLKNMPYRITLGYTDQEGIVRTSDFERYTASVNLNPTFFKDHLTFNINAKYMQANTRYNIGGVGEAVNMDPSQPIYDSSLNKYTGGYFQWMTNGTSLSDPLWGDQMVSDGTKNPVALNNQGDHHSNAHSFVGNIELDYKLHGFEDLRLHMNLGADFSKGNETEWYSPYSGNNNYYGYQRYQVKDKYNLSYNAYLQYYKDFNKNHHFDIMGGYEWQHFHNKYTDHSWGRYGIGSTLTDENTGKPLAGEKRNEYSNLGKGENYLVSFFGRMNYTLMERYMLTATVRYDGSSRFKDHWALFPSVALGWKIKEEAFLKDAEWLSDLKLRLGWGKTGQQEDIGDYNYFASYNISTGIGSQYPILGDGTMYRPNAYNADLKWETTTTWNAGLDFALFNNRFEASADYYYRKTTDLINDVFVAAGSNFRNQVRSNIGSLVNKGVEVALTWHALNSKDWRWDITANATYNDSEITELNGEGDDYYVATGGISAGTGNNSQAHKKGYPASSFYVYQQVYDANGKPLEGVYVDRDNDGKITPADKYIYKSPNAPWTAGLSSKLSYKNWDLGFSLRASFDNYVFNDVQAGMANVAMTFNPQNNTLLNRTPESIERGWQTYDSVLSDYYVQNGSFLKMDNLTLGYSFDNLFKGGRYKGLSGRVYLAATNVFTITNYDGVDPEVYGGIDNNFYPRPFTIQFGMNLNF